MNLLIRAMSVFLICLAALSIGCNPDDDDSQTDDDSADDNTADDDSSDDDSADDDIIDDDTADDDNGDDDDVSGELTWQDPPSDEWMTWEEAVAYCENLNYGGHDDWRLPTINELRSLIQGCNATEPGGACGVSHDCTESNCQNDPCLGCEYLEGPGTNGAYWPDGMSGEIGWSWSSSPVADHIDYAWLVHSYNAQVNFFHVDNLYDVRCVRWEQEGTGRQEQRSMNCRAFPKSAWANEAPVNQGFRLGAPKAGHATSDGFGLTVTDSSVSGRLEYYRFATQQIAWHPAVNVLLPEDYDQEPLRRYPVLYLLHGGAQGYQKFVREDDIIGLTTGRRLIVVMPDGGIAGWYSDPVTSKAGPRNWESFHINQLIPWIDANFRTFAEYDGRAVSGFSMGGFGALKYAAKYYGHFASISAHSGPPSLRRDGSIVALWASLSAKVAELFGGTLYGEPWHQGRISVDNPVERIDCYYGKRIFLVCGTAVDINESFVIRGQREFRALLDSRGIPHEWHELPGGHFVRREMLQLDIDEVIEWLRQAE